MANKTYKFLLNRKRLGRQNISEILSRKSPSFLVWKGKCYFWVEAFYLFIIPFHNICLLEIPPIDWDTQLVIPILQAVNYSMITESKNLLAIRKFGFRKDLS